MRKIAARLLEENDSYIEALSKAIEKWNMATSMKEKRDYIVAIGEIGNAIHRQNVLSKISQMDYE